MLPEDHGLWIEALEDLVARRSAEVTQEGRGKPWALNVVQAQELSREDQVRLAAQTNVSMGVGITQVLAD